MEAEVSAKSALRTELVEARRALPEDQRARLNAALVSQVKHLLKPGMTVAAYSPLPSEPGGPGFITALSSLCDTVYLPISLADGALAWSIYRGPEETTLGRLGISEPAGHREDSSILASCDYIFAPALAVHPAGFRLGKGAGYYDRALAQLPAGTATVVGVVYSHEIRSDVPAQKHDVPVEYILTENALLPAVPGSQV